VDVIPVDLQSVQLGDLPDAVVIDADLAAQIFKQGVQKNAGRQRADRNSSLNTVVGRRLA
jgi:hypothetical protein